MEKCNFQNVKAVVGENELQTIEEMAAKLKVKPSWLYFRTMQTGEGAIPRIKVGKYLRFNPSAVMEWIEKQYGEAE
ncbi:MAG TPA: helix-turn-helix domain-containing protein [Smithella sp.]|jgi:excisionase family DNA binding protein|nr:helix-turn-helix domain-containing protein [Smithella sp.]HQM44008.1 helix-turn-helix domain-containing protein [Smithellaceae bacterium]